MADLLSCPFCGGKNTESNIIEHEDDCYIIKALYAITGKSDFSQIEAIKAWNTRAEPVCVAKVTIPDGKLEKIKDDCMEYAKGCIAERTCKLVDAVAVGMVRAKGCYECGSIIERDYRYCPSCGAKVVE